MTGALIICMGVSGSGKSTLAQSLATHFSLPFLEADDFHSIENRQKMASGNALTDKDREPWMMDITRQVRTFQAQGCVLAHSGLRRKHRQQLRDLGLATIFLNLQTERATLAARLERRKGHYMPAALLETQLAAFESVVDEIDVQPLDASQSPAVLHNLAVALLGTFCEELSLSNSTTSNNTTSNGMTELSNCTDASAGTTSSTVCASGTSTRTPLV